MKAPFTLLPSVLSIAFLVTTSLAAVAMNGSALLGPALTLPSAVTRKAEEPPLASRMTGLTAKTLPVPVAVERRVKFPLEWSRAF